MNWDLSPKFEDQLFTFVPSDKVHKIEFEHRRPHGQGRSTAMTRREGRFLLEDRRYAGVRRAARWSPQPRRRYSSAPLSITARTARWRARPWRRRPWSEPRRSSVAWSTRFRPRVRRWSWGASPTSTAATPGISRATRGPRSTTSSSIRRRSELGLAAVAVGHRPGGLGHLGHSRGRVGRGGVGSWFFGGFQAGTAGRGRWRSAPTQVLTIATCPAGMSPPVAAASTRTPTSLSQASLMATVSCAVDAVVDRFVRATSRTLLASSPSRHANTAASSGAVTFTSGV